MLEVYLSAQDILPYYEVGDYPFNFGLLFYGADVNAESFLNTIKDWLENLPEGKTANWVVSCMLKNEKIVLKLVCYLDW